MQGIIRQLPAMLRDAFVLLRRNNPLILASATAFFATFSIPPTIIILVNITGLYFRSETVSEELFTEIRTIFGEQTATQIESIVHNFTSLNTGWWITIAGSLFLLFVATTLLSIAKQAIHQLWHIKVKSGHRFKYTLAERATALAMILSMGVLFTISLLMDASVTILHDYLHEIIPSVHITVVKSVQFLFSILVVATWFTVLFKVLPDAHVHWKVATYGGLLTTVLFTAGEYLLGRFLVYSNVATIFGTSAAIALLLLFIFYSSMIIYFGASFTYVFGKVVNKPVRAGKRGEEYEMNVLSNKSRE